jgi:hypothetical protein
MAMFTRALDLFSHLVVVIAGIALVGLVAMMGGWSSAATC